MITKNLVKSWDKFSQIDVINSLEMRNAADVLLNAIHQANNLQRFWRLNPDRTVEPVPMLALQPDDERRVDLTEVNGLSVSTVFLGIDHSFGRGDRPVLFETMVFGDEREYCERCCTYEEALEQHRNIVQKIRDGNLYEH